MNKIYKIYKIEFPNGECYIGRTSNHEYIRWGHHLSRCKAGKHSNNRIQSIYDKYGDEDWKFEVIKVEKSNDSSYISLLEEQFIKQFPNNVNTYKLNIDSKETWKRYYKKNKSEINKKNLKYYYKSKN